MANGSKAKYVVMGMLNAGPLTGYDIKKRFEGSIVKFWDLNYGQIYPTLKNLLEREGFVERTLVSSENRPNSKVYTLTGKGRQKLTDWLSGNVNKERLKYEIFLKLFFGSQISVEENIGNIREFRSKNLEELKNLEYFEEDREEVFKGSLNEKKRCYLVAMLMRDVHKACIEWADKAIEILEKTSAL